MKKLLSILFLLLLSIPFAIEAAVVFDATANSNATNGTSIPNFNITLGSGSNKAVLIGLSFSSNAVSGVTVTVGGQAASLISGTDSGTTGTERSLQFGRITTLSGVQAVAISWTGASSAVVGVVSATGVDQTTPFKNGTFSSGAATPASVTITSAAGDMTIDTIAVVGGGNAPGAPTQTSRWNTADGGNNVFGVGSTAAGAATVTHQWTVDGAWVSSGADFNQSVAAVPTNSCVLIKKAKTTIRGRRVIIRGR